MEDTELSQPWTLTQHPALCKSPIEDLENTEQSEFRSKEGRTNFWARPV